jgi:hypothetical protein
MELRYDNTDQIAYPMRGWRAKGQLSYKHSMVAGNWQLLSAQGQLIGYQPVGRSSSIGGRLLLQAHIGDNSAYLWQSAIGYWPAIIRGHELDVVDGQQMALLQAEWKQRIWQRQLEWVFFPVPGFSTIPIAVFLRPFLDAGRTRDVVNADLNPRNHTWLVGFGLGIDIVTYYDYALSVNLSRNGQGENGVYLHVNF